MRKTWLTGLVLLACCSDDKPSPEATVENKLRDCKLLSEGEFTLEFDDEVDLCPLRCFEQASCGDVRESFCSDEETFEDSAYAACLEKCGGDETLVCKDGSNDEADRCDGYEDCDDGEDEKGCSADAFFVCKDGDRVRREFKCDGEEDCFDGSDEDGCPADSFFMCKDGDRVPKEWRCDGEDDCDDGSDEAACPADTFFICDSGERVLKTWVCDGAPDCEDGSDEEQGCAKLLCGPDGSED